SISTLDRIGIVFRRSTTDWTWERQRSSLARSMVAFIATQTPLSTSDRNRSRAPEYIGLPLAGRRRAARKEQQLGEIGWGKPTENPVTRTSPYRRSHEASGR